MENYFASSINRLRITGVLEGISLLILICIGLPLKYIMKISGVIKFIGPIHGAIFLLFIFLSIGVASEYNWKRKMLFKILLASFIPFGTFYINKKILSKI